MLATAKSPNKEDMWGAYLQPFSFKRRASKHFSGRWKASSRSSCHISSFWVELWSTISRWGLCVRDFFLSPISLLHSHTRAPQPTAPLILCQYVCSPPPSVHFTILSLPPSKCFKKCTTLSVSALFPFFAKDSLPKPSSNAEHLWLFESRYLYILKISIYF